MALSSGARLGPYEIVGPLGVGGMGEVYGAYDTVRDRMVAVKVLRTEMAADAVFQERFRRESRVAARLQEPHVIPVHDFGDIGGVPTLFLFDRDGKAAGTFFGAPPSLHADVESKLTPLVRAR